MIIFLAGVGALIVALLLIIGLWSVITLFSGKENTHE